MRHVHAEHPQQPVPLPRGQIPQGVEDARNPRVVLGPPPVTGGAGERAAQDRQDPHVGSEHVLQEHDLELDRVLDGVAIIFEHHGVAAARDQLVDERYVHFGLAERGQERLAGQPETVRLAVVGSAEDDDGAAAMPGAEARVGRLVTAPPSLRADVGGGDADQARGRRRACRRPVRQVAVQRLAQRGLLGGVGRPGVGGIPPPALGEGAMPLGAQAAEVLVVEESPLAEDTRQVPHDLPDARVAGEPPQCLAHLVVEVAPVEESEAGHERRRDDDHRLCVAERIAHEEARPVGERRRHEVEVGPKRGQAGHVTHGT